MFGNVPHQSSILYLYFLRDDKTPCSQTDIWFGKGAVLTFTIQLKQKKNLDSIAFTILLPTFLPGIHKLQTVVCIMNSEFWLLDFSSFVAIFRS